MRHDHHPISINSSIVSYNLLGFLVFTINIVYPIINSAIGDAFNFSLVILVFSVFLPFYGVHKLLGDDKYELKIRTTNVPKKIPQNREYIYL